MPYKSLSVSVFSSYPYFTITAYKDPVFYSQELSIVGHNILSPFIYFCHSVCSCHSIEWLSSIIRKANLVLKLVCYQAQEMRAIMNFEAKDQACVLESCCQKSSKIMDRNKSCPLLEWSVQHSSGPTQTYVHLEKEREYFY